MLPSCPFPARRFRCRIGQPLRTLATLLLLWVVACQSATKPESEPAVEPKSAKVVKLEGVDTSQLTAREKDLWSTAVGELLAPCPDQPVSLAQCVMEKRKCDACLPAAEFLAQQVRKGKTRTQVDGAFRLRFSPEEVKALEIGSSPTMGPKDAAVTVVEWADFECPFCGMAMAVLEGTIKRFPGHVRFVFKHFPLSMHEHAEGAARAAAAAASQGKFWEMHHQLFTHQSELDDAGLAKLAAAVGLDVKKFEQARKGEAAADAVTADRKQGTKLGLQGTPSIFINGRAFDLDSFDLAEDLEGWLQLEIFLKTGKRVTPTPVTVTPPATPAGH